MDDKRKDRGCEHFNDFFDDNCGRYGKSQCDFETTNKKFEFSGVAREVARTISESEIVKEYGFWTDGIGIFSDNDDLCAYSLQVGVKYKITIEVIE